MQHSNALRYVINLVSPINDEDWQLMEPFLENIQISKGEFFIKIGQQCETIGFVIKGAMRTFYIDPAGEEISIHFQLENNFVVSYESFITKQPSFYNIEALEDCNILVFNRDTFENCCKKSHNWERFGRIIAEQMFVVSQKKMQSLLYQSAEERYVILQNSAPQLMQRIPQYLIASYLGIKPQSLSRIRKKMKEVI